ncbi:DNA helicase [Pseudovirgaria hyperparasitica]|uniref:DNA helicase n=1 Tax=Pseudovirgaria hyperparasitica TaxID=470096 RepID=A0A6A6WAY3_9PEZI|nr:DNA helicase [Pseudovirgaria hyperparasitica]KAF2759120.1 DNA helicase [Pseudovirgaria hyperparasitica]
MPPPPPPSIPAFAAAQLSLLDAELKAETAETSLLVSQSSPTTLQRAGLAVLNLQVASQRTGFGGKTVVELELDAAVGGGDIPEHGLRTGDIVAVQEQPAGSARKTEKTELRKRGVEGVVLKVTSGVIGVALDKDEADVPLGKLWLIKLANDVTYRSSRMNQTMKTLQDMKESEQSPFIQVLFGQGTPSPVDVELDRLSLKDDEWIDPSLNDSQKDAIRFALAAKEVALIHGPPGTGKTHTLIELILQMLKRNQRVLVCGPSNISVDNIVDRLAPHKQPIVRLGHPARLLPSVLNHSLEILTKTSDAAGIVQDVRRELDAKQASIRKTRSGKERRAIYGEMKELRKEYRERERGCVAELIRGSRVVLATLHGAGGFHLKNERFDCVVIDEASQALEAQCWIPLLSASKAVLAGDHLQLPPTIKSLNSKVRGSSTSSSSNNSKGTRMSLETTLFDRLLALHGASIKRMLTTQYRMHEKIMRFPSAELYEDKLTAAAAVKERLLRELGYGVQDSDETREALVFWDTQGGDFPERSEDDNNNNGDAAGKTTTTTGNKMGMGLRESKSNEAEAGLVKTHVHRLVAAGVKAEDIAVITPYNAQLSILSQLLKEAFPGIELGSVDGFQGREKEAVIVSLVRSNAEHEVGFLGERRRLNVAMTRPKRHLAIIGDSETVGRGSEFLNKWMLFLEEQADLRYATMEDVFDEGTAAMAAAAKDAQ